MRNSTGQMTWFLQKTNYVRKNGAIYENNNMNSLCICLEFLTLGKKNKQYNYKMFDLDWDFMLAQWLVNILGYMVPVATSQ